VEELLAFIAVGVVAGVLASRFMRGHGFGLVGDCLVGVAGAFIGGLIFTATETDLGGGIVGRLVVALIGALLLLLIVRLVMGRRRGRNVWS
jgi:uncharacterized membrane protein YeaQ/YmgE (transglycosylase-associated protein family)